MKDTSQQGLISHTAVLNRLVQLGVEVLLPWADHLGYDMAYYVETTERSFGFFVHNEARLVRIQVKTGRLSKDEAYLVFNTSTVSPRKNGINRKSGYKGKAEYFAVYSPDTSKIYKVAVDEAPVGNMNLRFKTMGVMRSGRHHNYNMPYSQEIADKYTWAEDYEM